MSTSSTDNKKTQPDEVQEEPGAELQSMTVKVPTDTWRRARIYSLDTGKTLSDIVSDALWSFFTALEVKGKR